MPLHLRLPHCEIIKPECVVYSGMVHDNCVNREPKNMAAEDSSVVLLSEAMKRITGICADPNKVVI